MKTTNEVAEAVRLGEECSEKELRFAVRNLSIWQNSIAFPLARAITEDPISDKTRRALKGAWDRMHQGNAAPLDQWLEGSSLEPGISREESTRRFAEKTGDVAVKLLNTLKQGLS